ncbi:HlyD family efflux transporter periplasmic adaptor subunit [Flavobacterium sp.]|uniref:HlyD family efflux transporter periplasmic adaptor subunit n=1 Tax=Flavobacterium sp. TaxID=239 RepID=UPI00262E3E51|nr:HlyD family efflux transporter periplasmic adaptor subunit [Flavobacterium sp.]
MDKQKIHKSLHENRTEEVAHLIEKMPVRFGIAVSGIAIGLVLLLLIFGWLIKYPEVLHGQITLNTRQAPVKIVSTTTGNLVLLQKKGGTTVQAGTYLGYIKNSARLTDVQTLDRLLHQVAIHKLNSAAHRYFFPETLSLGDVNNAYFGFLSALYQFLDYKEQQPFVAQKKITQKLLKMQKTTLAALQNDFENQQIKYNRSMELFKRDSVLFSKKVTASADFDKSVIAKANTVLDFKAIDKQITNTDYQIQEAENKLELLAIEKSNKETELIIKLYNSYYYLLDAIKKWEQTYVFIAPISGKIDYLSFLKNDDFIQSGQEMFKIIPNKNEIIGQVNLPEQGSGKVKIGQDVIIKLDNYPYNEYGSVKGKVSRISLATNEQTLSNKENKVNAYLVQVRLTDGLKTNYGTVLNFHAEAKGTAEIITEDRRLIERFFDNLKYKTK